MWSLGVVLYEAVCGVKPFLEAEGVGDLIFRINTVAVVVQDVAPWVPTRVAQIIEKAMRIEPEERFQTAREMLEAIEMLLPHGTEICDASVVPKSRPPMPSFPAVLAYDSIDGGLDMMPTAPFSRETVLAAMAAELANPPTPPHRPALASRGNVRRGRRSQVGLVTCVALVLALLGVALRAGAFHASSPVGEVVTKATR